MHGPAWGSRVSIPACSGTPLLACPSPLHSVLRQCKGNKIRGRGVWPSSGMLW